MKAGAVGERKKEMYEKAEEDWGNRMEEEKEEKSWIRERKVQTDKHTDRQTDRKKENELDRATDCLI